MLTLTNPSALLALLGLLVPLAIHLWNRRPGREVAVGSLRWLAAGANRRLRNLRLEQVSLLLLRAILLAGLAGALAGPQWRQPRPAGRGQVLVSPELADGSRLAAVRPTLDSLRRRGYVLRWLAAGLPAITPAEWQADSLGHHNYLLINKLNTISYWARIQQAADTFAGQPLYAVTPAALSGLGGAHPALPANLTWQTLPARTATTWLQAAAASPGSLRLLVGQSDEKQTTFRAVRVSQPQPGTTLTVAGLPPLRYEVAGGRANLRPISTDSSQAQHPVPVQAAALRVMLYATAGYAEEARYLRAALRAAEVGLAAPLALTVSATPPDPAAAADWLFWLSDSPVPAAWRRQVPRGLRLWQEATGPGVADTATLATAATAGATPILLTRRGRQPMPAGSQPRWADGRGRPVLAELMQGQGAAYQLTTRLNPAWSTFADSPALPALLLDLLATNPQLGTDTRLTAHDQRRLDPAQLPASRIQSATNSNTQPAAYQLTDLRPWLVLALAFLFGLERWLAQRRAATSSLSTSV
ncbi:BatA domain-containing protein [Hymenobacter sp. H14-R3]|uniref:BatA domain-containing protein n=1 Tax=Hymenobacter sp. H14-R3 TaxID=3046308 RepID=UPI0024B97F39|nr:BatA domain-containing protein [Hymenobacter sp. H14-R3]MDJ0366116.1 BatA domain-containing protein [Hymenobacter sp. H14-R3]